MKANIINFIKTHYTDPMSLAEPSQPLYERQPKIPNVHVKAMVDFYNLAYAKDKEVREFIGNYLLEVPFSKTGNPDMDKAITEGCIRDTMELYESLRAELPVFQAIVDKVLLRKELSDTQIARLRETIGYSAFIQAPDPFGEGWMLMLLNDRKSQFLKAVYSCVVGLSQSIVYVRRCRLEGCNKLFIPNRSGSEQIYCSTNHRKRAFALKKDS